MALDEEAVKETHRQLYVTKEDLRSLEHLIRQALDDEEAGWRSALDPGGRLNHVTAYTWGCFLADFGPMPRSALREWSATARSAWFSFTQSESEARRALANAVEGSFLLYRFGQLRKPLTLTACPLLLDVRHCCANDQLLWSLWVAH